MTARWLHASGLTLLLLGALLLSACSTGGNKSVVRPHRRAPGKATALRHDPQAAALYWEAEARRIAAATAPLSGSRGQAAGVAYNPDADPAAEPDDLFPEPVELAEDSLALYEPVGTRMLHFAGTMLPQAQELDLYIEAVGEELAPAGIAAWFTLKGPRGWKVDVELLANGLERAQATGGMLNLSLSLKSWDNGHGGALDEAIAITDTYDKRIDEIADLIRVSGVRVLLRIGNEINGWQGHHPFLFPMAYRKIVSRFRLRGADKVAFVWCVVPHGDADIFGTNEAGEFRWFPGDDVVDWYSINLFDRLHFSPLAGRGRVGADRFSTVTQQLLGRARRMGKPVLIGESTPKEMNVVSGREDPRGERGATVWHEWFLPFLAFLDSHQEIKAVTMLTVDWRKTSAWPEWGDSRIHRNPTIIGRWRDELSRRRWMHLDEVLGDTSGVLGARPEEPVTTQPPRKRERQPGRR